ncbi:group III truncated hemoglobin [Rhodoblastus acidophilus]|uniref:Group III truncated hemoglobin n=1 Tax=Candidatus Rhodoblastus alkanivorans TaxID=2954117 RepID=A0ABS9Z471_9HYPH|nr:group III truncated hemoglobin [Candidatus Rhodoblastus alkanivorans]MCI4679739.1 group III truncated hemoglobin [Candidatus Rhodoblastus alkanivorans]MCI4681977.1 group III truncated hemoglobin [Candidatus Rhodoblastus alkanivorans]MDI4643028.1 group III truncated hemoglobin [Rhodoblastus acidophilus]
MPHPLAIRSADFEEPPQGLTEEMMARLVREFYTRARADPDLGPIFEEKLAGHWEEHFSKLTDFWSQIGLRTGRYNGRPLPAHAALGLEPHHFKAWLDLFAATARDVLAPEAARFFVARANRIAESFQIGLNIGDKAIAFRAAQAARDSE